MSATLTRLSHPRYTKDRPRLGDTLEVIKFLCKDFWTAVFKKQVDNLRTNHRVGVGDGTEKGRGQRGAGRRRGDSAGDSASAAAGNNGRGKGCLWDRALGARHGCVQGTRQGEGRGLWDGCGCCSTWCLKEVTSTH